MKGKSKVLYHNNTIYIWSCQYNSRRNEFNFSFTTVKNEVTWQWQNGTFHLIFSPAPRTKAAAPSSKVPLERPDNESNYPSPQLAFLSQSVRLLVQVGVSVSRLIIKDSAGVSSRLVHHLLPLMHGYINIMDRIMTLKDLSMISASFEVTQYCLSKIKHVFNRAYVTLFYLLLENASWPQLLCTCFEIACIALHYDQVSV